MYNLRNISVLVCFFILNLSVGYADVLDGDGDGVLDSFEANVAEFLSPILHSVEGEVVPDLADVHKTAVEHSVFHMFYCTYDFEDLTSASYSITSDGEWQKVFANGEVSSFGISGRVAREFIPGFHVV